VLGGVEVPSDRGLDGHSDADVLTHAVIDALLGAASLADMGVHFPDTEDRWHDADSIVLLGEVRSLLAAHGLEPVHLDATVICEAPRLGPYRDAMRERLAQATGLELQAVSVKFTTSEGMGFIGRGEGIVALATATVAEGAAGDG
jgi:2-C-methyl-D-erythritol 2,4-cyclodiphosphate synthase